MDAQLTIPTLLRAGGQQRTRHATRHGRSRLLARRGAQNFSCAPQRRAKPLCSAVGSDSSVLRLERKEGQPCLSALFCGP